MAGQTAGERGGEEEAHTDDEHALAAIEIGEPARRR
jgi:hypothetical protein